MTGAAATWLAEEEVLARIAAIPDPEVPVVTIAGLGILREITAEDGVLHVVVTPTYSGCPAMDAIRARVELEAERAGWRAEVETRLLPAWTTDWVTPEARAMLQDSGIAPPGPVGVSLGVRRVACPLCGSGDTEELSRFGATACKALRRCRSCREPFEQFKAL